MIYACERVRDVERAAQWCDTVRGFADEWSVPQLFGFCRSHYASVLMWRGAWDDAEEELTAASRAFELGAPALVYEGIMRLAELRRRQSRLEEAADLCERIAWHPAAQLCLAEIALDQGDARTARDLVARHLRALPAAERLGRASGLELGIRVHLALDDVPAAAAGLDELQALADAGGTTPLHASLRFSRGLVARARDDPAAARRELEDAVDMWSRMRAPYELARGRIALAELALATDRPDEAARELRLARPALQELDAPAELDRVAALLLQAEPPRRFDWGAGHYERTAAQLASVSDVVVERAAPHASERVLDLGCGTGNAALLAAARGATVTGVDPAARLLDVARARASEHGLDITFARGEAAALPMASGSVDVLLSVFGVIFAPDPVAAAAETARVTAPHGRIVLSAWLPGGTVSQVVRMARETAAGSSFAWHDRDALSALLTPHGFSVEVEAHAHVFTAASIDDFLGDHFIDHPLGMHDEIVDRARELLTAANEQPGGFAVTRPYVVAVARR
jgi:SAM-dependent methyltransferase